MELQVFIGKLLTLSQISAKSIEDIPPTFKTQLLELTKELETFEEEQCSQILSLLDGIISQIILDWKTRQESNYIVFPFKKLKSAVHKQIGRLKQPIMMQILDKQVIIENLLKSSKGTSRQFPDSLHAFVNAASDLECFSLFIPSHLEWPSSVPVIFSLNAENLNYTNIKEINISSGHCLVGAEPGEENKLVIENALKYGIAAQDVLQYEQVKALSEFLFRKNVKNSVTVHLDTLYYRDKLVARSNGKLKPIRAMEVITRVSSEHQGTIKSILPNSKIVASHEQTRLEQLNEITDKELLEFVASQYPMLGSRVIEGIAKVAASYLYTPLIEDKYTLFIESALDVQIPAQIVIPYLKKKQKLGNFCFIGLLPLPDLKMSHGSMYFGNAEKGKLYIKLSKEQVVHRVQSMSVNWLKPHNCFYTQYFLVRGNTLPSKNCHPSLCRDHIQMVINDFQNLQQVYGS